jgi:hypothetical protein
VGDGTQAERDTPVPVGPPAGVQQVTISNSGESAATLLADGTVDSWGSGEFGVLGSGTLSGSPTPAPVLNLAGITQISA